MTDTAVILALSNVSTACIVGTFALAALETYKRQKAAEFAEAKVDRAEAEKALTAVTESREHDFAVWLVQPQPQQQHAAADTPAAAALSDLSHADEQVTADDLGAIGPEGEWRMPWWGWLCLPLIPVAGGVALLVLAWDWVSERVGDAVADWRQTRRDRNEVGTGEGIRAVLIAAGYDLSDDINYRGSGWTRKEYIAGTVTALRSTGHTDYDIAAELADLFGEDAIEEIAELVADNGETVAEAEAIEVKAIRKASNLPYRGRHWLSDVQHTGTFPIVPAQREAAE